MRKNEIQLSEAELEIMNVIWQSEKEISTAEILKSDVCANWSRTTVSTFLSRLVGKGALNARKEGSTCLYTSMLNRNDYRERKTESFLQSFYGGSAKALAMSLFKKGDLTREDIEQLREMFLKEKSDE